MEGDIVGWATAKGVTTHILRAPAEHNLPRTLCGRDIIGQLDVDPDDGVSCKTCETMQDAKGRS